MTLWRLILRNLRFHTRANAAVLMGIVAAAAALSGALVVGDSVKATLRRRALDRVFGAEWAIGPGEKFFRQELKDIQPGAAAVIALPGVARNDSGTAAANNVQVLGVDDAYFRLGPASQQLPELNPDKAWLSPALARQLKAGKGDEIVLRVQKPDLLPGDAALTPRDEQTMGWRMEVAGVVGPRQGGNLDLSGGAGEPMNVFVNLATLADRAGLRGKANLLLIPGPGDGLRERLAKQWRFEDAGLKVVPGGPQGPVSPAWEVRSSSVFIPDPALKAIAAARTNAIPILTYLANLVIGGSNATPYSMITAAGPPYTPADMKDDEILVNEWLAEDLKVKPGDLLRMVYFRPESGAALAEATNIFLIRSVVPLRGIYADKTLMPGFPGIEEAERAHDWKGGFPLTYPIRDRDEDYWNKHRGTPKAFITPDAGRKLWANRFGAVTAVRVPVRAGVATDEAAAGIEQDVLAGLTPEQMGLSLAPVRERALFSASQGQDFGQLFLGFSMFLIFGALLLVWLLLQLAVETRAAETGTLLATGFSEGRVRRVYLMEALCLAVLGGFIGTVAGVLYANGLLWGLRTVWKDAVAGMAFDLHVTALSVATAWVSATVMSLAAVWFAIRGQGRRPARELLAGGAVEQFAEVGRARVALFAGCVCVAAASGLVIWALFSKPGAAAPVFFSAGTLMLAGTLSLARHFFGRIGTTPSPLFSASRLILSSLGRRPKRSLATVALLAGGAFVIIAVSAFRLDARSEGGRRDSGTGGFALIAGANLPVLHDLNTPAGREALGLQSGPTGLPDINVVALRVHKGEEASCLNLGRAQAPRLMGVRPEALAGRFKFVETVPHPVETNGWNLLIRSSSASPDPANREIPAIGDANSIKWALGKKVGDTIEYVDEQGRPFKVKIVGALANSVLQGSLLICEPVFNELFPSEAGHKFFLIDSPSGAAGAVSEKLSVALSDYGLECVSATERLNQFNAVQNTYLGTFQLLGALGLLLGSVGLAVVIFRNLLERRGELAVLLAAGFSRGKLSRMVFIEHVLLLAAGLAAGGLAAVVALLPAIAERQEIGWISLGLTLVAVLLNGLAWAWLATRSAMASNPAETLKAET